MEGIPLLKQSFETVGAGFDQKLKMMGFMDAI
jgi:hypothetical protein